MILAPSALMLADILLWDGNPLENIDLILDESKLHLVMKDGKIYKDIM